MRSCGSRFGVLLVAALVCSACVPAFHQRRPSPPLVSDEVSALVRETFEHFHPEAGATLYPPQPGFPSELPSWFGDTIYVLDTVKVGATVFRLREDVLPRERANFKLASLAWMRRRADWRYKPVKHVQFIQVTIRPDSAEVEYSPYNQVVPNDKHMIDLGTCYETAMFARTEAGAWQFTNIEQGACS